MVKNRQDDTTLIRCTIAVNDMLTDGVFCRPVQLIVSTFLEIIMQDKILNWFGTGEVGSSSKAMALAVTGNRNDGSHPYDPGDLNRCLLLLEAVPEMREHMDKIASMSKTWGKLVARWDEVEQCFLDEVGLNWTKARSAPKTYELMKAIAVNDRINGRVISPSGRITFYRRGICLEI